jgi:hypothetical protein
MNKKLQNLNRQQLQQQKLVNTIQTSPSLRTITNPANPASD